MSDCRPVNRDGEAVNWTGPDERDLMPDGQTIRPEALPLPPERWPYGEPEAHEDCCILHEGGAFCDCAASAADDGEGLGERVRAALDGEPTPAKGTVKHG